MIQSGLTRRSFGRAAFASAALAIVPFRYGLVQPAAANATGTVTMAELNQMSAAEFVSTLGETFERGPWVVASVVDKRPFANATVMHAAMFEALRAAPHDRQLAFLGGDVDVLVSGKEAASVTGQSKREQGSVGFGALSETAALRFQFLNEAYTAKFGFPFIIAVLRYTRDAIITQLASRLRNDVSAEFATAIQEVFYISRIRLAALITGGGMLKVNGLLDTHVLDTVTGGPAVGMKIELFEFSDDQAFKIAETVTDADGRNATPLIADRPLPIGRYELRFSVGDYFSKRASGLNDPPFLDIVPLRFAIAEPETHYHVPLLCSPWSYSTYKGS